MPPVLDIREMFILTSNNMHLQPTFHQFAMTVCVFQRFCVDAPGLLYTRSLQSVDLGGWTRGYSIDLSHQQFLKLLIF